MKDRGEGGVQRGSRILPVASYPKSASQNSTPIFSSSSYIALQQSEPARAAGMFRDDISLPPSGMPSPHPLIHGYDEVPTPPAPPQQNDDNNLDDIWGSAPSSPTLLTADSNPRSNDNPDFGANANQTHRIDREVSDIPRLRSEHSTAGYRDGIAAAKGTTIQAGFDEGYSLGAVIGLRVGKVLGTLEGVSSALTKSSGVGEEEKLRIKALVEKARRELKTEEVFGRDWWGEDGIWTFEVKSENEGEVTFNDVADAHPLIKKWEEIVENEAAKRRLDLEVLDRQEVQRLGEDE